MRISRDDRSILANWWFTADMVLLIAILVLMAAGVVLSLAASPAIALKRGLPTYYFVERQVLFAATGAVVMLTVSLLSPVGVRRFALALCLSSLALMVAVLLTGTEVNGARRWLRLAGYSLQPSEFLKPGFAVTMAWLFALSQRIPSCPLHPTPDPSPSRGGEQRARYELPLVLALAIFAISAGLLVLQPDIGQTVLIGIVYGTLFFVSGGAMRWAAALAGLGLAGLAGAYMTLSHVRARIDRFLDPASGDSYQSDKAIQSFMEGGFFGRGPGEGTIKHVLPDAHTDYIFAVVAEEYGVLACLVLIGLFLFVVFRALSDVWRRPDPFVRMAVIALVLLFAAQSAINMAVNVGLLPSKGMTLPFISAGGSSTLALALSMGMILALTRQRPDDGRLKKPRFTDIRPVEHGFAAEGVNYTERTGIPSQ